MQRPSIKRKPRLLDAGPSAQSKPVCPMQVRLPKASPSALGRPVCSAQAAGARLHEGAVCSTAWARLLTTQGPVCSTQARLFETAGPPVCSLQARPSARRRPASLFDATRARLFHATSLSIYSMQGVRPFAPCRRACVYSMQARMNSMQTQVFVSVQARAFVPCRFARLLHATSRICSVQARASAPCRRARLLHAGLLLLSPLIFTFSLSLSLSLLFSPLLSSLFRGSPWHSLDENRSSIKDHHNTEFSANSTSFLSYKRSSYVVRGGY